VIASAVGPPRAIAGALSICAAYGVWATATTPHDAKHLAGRRRVMGTAAPPPAVVVDLDADVIDLVALEAPSASASAWNDADVSGPAADRLHVG